jgi:hypothetical protein
MSWTVTYTRVLYTPSLILQMQLLKLNSRINKRVFTKIFFFYFYRAHFSARTHLNDWLSLWMWAQNCNFLSFSIFFCSHSQFLLLEIFLSLCWATITRYFFSSSWANTNAINYQQWLDEFEWFWTKQNNKNEKFSARKFSFLPFNLPLSILKVLSACWKSVNNAICWECAWPLNIINGEWVSIYQQSTCFVKFSSFIVRILIFFLACWNN